MNRIKLRYIIQKKERQRCKSKCKDESGHSKGPSSFGMHNANAVFDSLKLNEGDSFLDLGCGSGDYSINAARIIGENGVVYALDIWENLITSLSKHVTKLGLINVKPMQADITMTLPLEDNCCDVCLIATVLHAIDRPEIGKILEEVSRVLKPNGRVAIIECKKDNSNFGPPKHMRFSPEELESIAFKYGFKKIDLIDLGHNYMIQFCK